MAATRQRARAQLLAVDRGADAKRDALNYDGTEEPVHFPLAELLHEARGRNATRPRDHHVAHVSVRTIEMEEMHHSCENAYERGAALPTSLPEGIDQENVRREKSRPYVCGRLISVMLTNASG